MAKVLRDTTDILVDPGDDPGDYPNNVASGPLPSRPFIAGIEGEIKVKLRAWWLPFIGWFGGEVAEVRELLADDLQDEFRDWVDDHVKYGPYHGVLSFTWTKELKGRILTLWVEGDVEPDPDYREDDYEPDYDPVDEYERREMREIEADLDAEASAGKDWWNET